MPSMFARRGAFLGVGTLAYNPKVNAYRTTALTFGQLEKPEAGRPGIDIGIVSLANCREGENKFVASGGCRAKIMNAFDDFWLKFVALG